jgi:hypothetical protein
MGYPQKRVIAILLCLVVVIAVFSSRTPYSPQQFSGPKAASTPKNNVAEETPEQAIARYNYWLTWVTFILAVATAGLGGIGIFQIRLARAEFIASHRPRLRIRRIFPIAPFRFNEAPRIRILAANIGDTAANVFEYGWEIYTDIYYTPPALPIPFPQSLKVPPGKQINIDFVGPVALTAENATAALDGWIFIVGIINYMDDQGIIRATSFARRYSTQHNRFVPVGHEHRESDREYEN